jgi:T5orf172 domain
LPRILLSQASRQAFGSLSFGVRQKKYMKEPAPSLLDMLNANQAHLSPEELRAHITNLSKVARSSGHVKEAIIRDSSPRKEYLGFIYILSHPRMPGILKIGYTEKSVTDRIAQLSAPTGVPGRFTMEDMVPVCTPPRTIEREIHKRLSALWEEKEFFRVGVSHAKQVVREVVTENEK